MKRSYKYRATVNDVTNRNGSEWLYMLNRLWNRFMTLRDKTFMEFNSVSSRLVVGYDGVPTEVDGEVRDQKHGTLVVKRVVVKKGPNGDVHHTVVSYENITCRSTANGWTRLCHHTGQTMGLYSSGIALCYHLPPLKKQYPEYSLIGSQVLKDEMKRLDKAFSAFLSSRRQGSSRKVGHPKFKPEGKRSRVTGDIDKSQLDGSFTFPNSSGWSIEGNQLWVKNLGIFRLRGCKRLPIPTAPIKIATVTVKRDVRGQWWVTFACDGVPTNPLPHTGRSIGLDVGLNSFLTDSDGVKVENPKFFRRYEERLAYLQKKKDGQKRGSNRRKETARLISRLHEKIANCRLDHARKVARQYAKTNDLIAIEDLKIQNMVQQSKKSKDAKKAGNGKKSTGLRKSISDVGWGIFRHCLENKCEEFGRTLLPINPAGTSKTCSHCGHVQDMPMGVGTYLCPSCGLEIDRDINAAINIMAKGLEVAV